MTVSENPTAKATFTSFAESTKNDWDTIMLGIKHTQSMVPDRILEQLRHLANDMGGFPVSRLDHCLQTATRAMRGGENDEYVACALIHDIGDTLSPQNHPSIAAGIVKPIVSEANHWMVLHHGIFQGYYFWQHIGLDPNTRDAYRESPFFDYTAEFCAKYDQVAFDPDYKSESLEFFEPLIREMFSGQAQKARSIVNY